MEGLRAYEYLPDPVIICQQEKIIYINEMAEQLLGGRRDQIIGESILQFVLPKDTEEMTSRLQEMFTSNERTKLIEIQIHNLHNEIIDVEVGSSLIYFDGEPAALNVMRNITERKKIQTEMTQMAYHDALTGLPNRRKLIEQLTLLIERNHNQSAPFSVLAIDLDRFKTINDTLGHAYGDYVLVEFGARLQLLHLEHQVTIARIGGDEFTILLHEYRDQLSLIEFADRVMEICRQPFFLKGIKYDLSASVGIVNCPEGKGTVAKLLDNADVAMYEQKKRGKNGYQFFSIELIS